MKQIYVVMGQTGEYSDPSEWYVRAFVSEEKAQEYVSLCSQYARENRCDDRSRIPDYAEWRRIVKDNPYDKSMEVDYTGCNYSYFPIELDETPVDKLEGKL